MLVLGPGDGWHAEQLRGAAASVGLPIQFADYETLTAVIGSDGRLQGRCAAGPLARYAVVLCRTMPLGSLEQITFRLAILQAELERGLPIVNPPRTLELAIDKFAALAKVAHLGYPVPETAVVQSRRDALTCFVDFGQDVVVKPIFGGEGRGVMRVQNRELAWSTFTTLERLNAVIYMQRFVPPGGRDTRLLVIGQQVLAFRRTNECDFRTNTAGGASCQAIVATIEQREMALRIANVMNLKIGSVDLLDCTQSGYVVLEVNGVPGWKAAQSCLAGCREQTTIAQQMIAYLHAQIAGDRRATVPP